MRNWLSVCFTDAKSKEEKISNCYLHSNSLSNKMDNSLLAVRDINHKYIVVGRKLYQPVQSAVTESGEKICRAVQTERERVVQRWKQNL